MNTDDDEMVEEEEDKENDITLYVFFEGGENKVESLGGKKKKPMNLAYTP